MANFIKNSALYLISTIVLKATSFLLLPLYSSLISPDAYGQVYIVNSIITFLSIFLTFSLNAALQRYFFDCKNDRDVQRLYSTIFYFVLAVSTVIISLLIGFNNIIARWLKIATLYSLLAFITIYLSLFYNLIIALLYIKQDAVKISIASIVIGVIQIISQVYLVIHMEDKALATVISLLIGGLLQFGVFIIFSRPYLVLYFNKKLLIPSLKYGLSQFLSDISNWIVSFFDRIILNKYQDSGAVGIYGMGHTLATIPSVLFQSMNKALSPKVFENFKQYEDGVVGNVSYAVSMVEKVFVFITIVLSLLVAFANNIIHILSSQYESSALVMFLVLFACLLDIYRMLFMYPLAYNVRYVKVKSIIWVIASIACIFLNLVLIPKYSYLGACVTLIIVNSITLGLIVYFSRKAIEINYHSFKLISVFTISLLYGCSFFLGDGIMQLIIKLMLSGIYLFIIWKIYPIDYKTIIRSFKR